MRIESTLSRPDGHRITVRCWRPPSPPLMSLQLLHGLAEHIGRYGRLIDACLARGIAVVGHDHRGHGPDSGDSLGHFADRNGWNRIVEDALDVQAHGRGLWPGIPMVLFGHSMGSYIAQSCAARAPGRISALVLSGSSYGARRQLRAGRALAHLATTFSGGRRKSALLNRLGLGSFNRRFSPARTDFDWLSRDEAEVDRYVADPYCGFPLSNRLWLDLLGGLLEITSLRTLRRIPAALPVLITGGEKDPVGGPRGMAQLVAAYEQSGHSNVTLKVWPDGRHEMLNELEREAFTAFVLEWMAHAVADDAVPKDL